MTARRSRRGRLSLSVIYLHRRGRFLRRPNGCRYNVRQFLARRDGCGRSFRWSRARQWWRVSDPMVFSASSDVVGICSNYAGEVSIRADVVSTSDDVVSTSDDVLRISDDVIRPIGNIMHKHRQA